MLVNADGLKLPVGGQSEDLIPLNVQRRFISGPVAIDDIEKVYELLHDSKSRHTKYLCYYGADKNEIWKAYRRTFYENGRWFEPEI